MSANRPGHAGSGTATSSFSERTTHEDEALGDVRVALGVGHVGARADDRPFGKARVEDGDARDRLEAVAVGHLEVADERVERMTRSEERDGVVGARDRDDVEVDAHHSGEGVSDALVVVDEE